MYELKVEKLKEDLNTKEVSCEENQKEIERLKNKLIAVQNDLENTEILNNDLVSCSFS